MNQMNREIIVGEKYLHFKGNLYQVLAIALHTETQERLVIYQALYGSYEIYARPYSMFASTVDPVKHPDILQKYRFARAVYNGSRFEAIE